VRSNSTLQHSETKIRDPNSHYETSQIDEITPLMKPHFLAPVKENGIIHSLLSSVGSEGGGSPIQHVSNQQQSNMSIYQQPEILMHYF
jgi:hypothetical protein